MTKINLPTGWEIKKLKDVATYVNGRAFKPNEWSDEGLPIVRIQNLTNVTKPYNFFSGDCDNKYMLSNGDILISWSASLGVYLWDRGPALLNQHIFKVLFNKVDINKVYFMYAIRTKIEHMMKLVHGSTMKHITKQEFERIEIPIPPYLVQKQIATILQKATQVVEKRRNASFLLDSYLQSVFLDMFGNPIRNPKGWEMGTIGDLTLKTQYGTSKKASEEIAAYPILRMNNITYEGGWNFSSLKYIDLSEEEQKKYLVFKGEVLFNRTNSKELVGKTSVYREEKPMAFAGYLIKLIPNEKANAEFISAYLNSSHGKSTLLSIAKSIVGMANINAEELKKIKIYLPPKELQDKFSTIVERSLKLKNRYKESETELQVLFNSLLKRALSGELIEN